MPSSCITRGCKLTPISRLRFYPTMSLGWLKEIIRKEGGGYLLSRAGIRKEPVHWGDMDSMKHVNNVVYLKKFEAARINYLLQLEKLHIGTCNFLSGKGVGPIMRSVDLAWKYPITYPDEISVLQKVAEIEHDRFHVKAILVAHGPQVLASRISEVQVTVDYRKVPTAKTAVPAEWRRALEQEMEAQLEWEKEWNQGGATKCI